LLAVPEHNAGPVRVKQSGIVWELRAPTSRDLAAVVAATDVQVAREAILARCAQPIEDAATMTAPPPASDSDGRPAELVAHLGALDPLAEILIDLNCPQCGHAWRSLFDIVTFLWNEVRIRARRLLQEVDLLARTYGWSEREILALSDRRRQWYVQMALS
jgi:hypothetical protein